MLQNHLKISFVIVLLGLNQNTFASDDAHKQNHNEEVTVQNHGASASKEEQIFILQGDHNPVLVVPESSPEAKSSKFMRMPNLSEEDLDNGIVLKQRRSGMGHEKHSSAITNKIKTDPKVKPLQFSAAKIAGKVRLPRVNFAKVGIPMEIRDETPSLDFTGKSLTTGGL